MKKSLARPGRPSVPSIRWRKLPRGAAYYPKDLAEVEKLTPEIAHEIRNQYTIVYSPLNENLDGSFRRIKVELSGQYRGATVRAKNGYYATPDTPKTTSSLSKP